MEDTNAFMQFINKHWKDKWIYLMSVPIFIILNLPFVNTYNIHSKKSWLTVFAITVLIIMLFLPIYIKRRFPKF